MVVIVIVCAVVVVVPLSRANRHGVAAGFGAAAEAESRLVFV